MPDFIRVFRPGGIFFFTLVTHDRRPIFEEENARKILGGCFRECRQLWAFDSLALVLLPEHLHLIAQLPRGDSEYSRRLGWIKKEFTSRWLQDGGEDLEVSSGRQRDRRKGIWQPRFWEHTIRDERDLESHFDYVHFNPVKHGHVRCPKRWPHSSFHRWVKAGHYPENWACQAQNRTAPNFDHIKQTVGE